MMTPSSMPSRGGRGGRGGGGLSRQTSLRLTRQNTFRLLSVQVSEGVGDDCSDSEDYEKEEEEQDLNRDQDVANYPVDMTTHERNNSKNVDIVTTNSFRAEMVMGKMGGRGLGPRSTSLRGLSVPSTSTTHAAASNDVARGLGRSSSSRGLGRVGLTTARSNNNSSRRIVGGSRVRGGSSGVGSRRSSIGSSITSTNSTTVAEGPVREILMASDYIVRDDNDNHCNHVGGNDNNNFECLRSLRSSDVTTDSALEQNPYNILLFQGGGEEEEDSVDASFLRTYHGITPNNNDHPPPSRMRSDSESTISIDHDTPEELGIINSKFDRCIHLYELGSVNESIDSFAIMRGICDSVTSDNEKNNNIMMMTPINPDTTDKKAIPMNKKCRMISSPYNYYSFVGSNSGSYCSVDNNADYSKEQLVNPYSSGNFEKVDNNDVIDDNNNNNNNNKGSSTFVNNHSSNQYHILSSEDDADLDSINSSLNSIDIRGGIRDSTSLNQAQTLPRLNNDGGGGGGGNTTTYKGIQTSSCQLYDQMYGSGTTATTLNGSVSSDDSSKG